MLASTTNHSADTEYLVRNAMTTGYQISSLIAPPLYLIYTFSSRGRGSFSVNRLLRATWLGGAGGILTSGALAYAWYRTCNDDLLRSKRIRADYDIDRVGANDHATIGLVVTSILITGVFWKRAAAVNLILGGAGLGSSFGLLVFHGRSFLGDDRQAREISSHKNN